MAVLIIPLGVVSAQTPDKSASTSGVIDDLLSSSPPTSNVGIVSESHKFDDRFYQKIQDLLLEDSKTGNTGRSDSQRYYDVIIIVDRNDGDERSPEETAKENKDAIVKRLQLLGARNILAAESLSFVTASVPIRDIPGFSTS